MRKRKYTSTLLSNLIKPHFQKCEVFIPTNKKPVVRLTEVALKELEVFFNQYGIKLTKI